MKYTKLDPNAIPADMPEQFYILGEVNGNKWLPSVGVPMERSGATFSAVVTVNGYFSFAKKLAADWNALNADGNRYGLSVDGTIGLNQPVVISQINDPKAIGLSSGTPVGSYRITVDWSDMSVTLSEPTSGIDATEAVDADAPVEYYNLQGLRVEQPLAPGLYIRRQGNTVTKVLVK